ncbi:MAG: hypothetical protein IPJ65_40565 [Archangiaceae bacterium]|nr:hypothetical protein [Archangiaceae bacterium]
MRLNEWRSTVGTLRRDLPSMDLNGNRRVTVREGAQYLEKIGGAGADEAVEYDATLAARLNALLGGDATHPHSVTLAEAAASLDRVMGWVETELPRLDPTDSGQIDLDAAKRAAGGDLPLYSADAVGRLLLGLPSADAEAALRDARRLVDGLGTEIDRLERSNTGKAAQVTALTQQIAQRKSELQREYDRKRNVGLVGALFGIPAVVALSLIEMQRDDGRLSQLQRELDAAQADRSRIQSRLTQYGQLKRDVEAQVSVLERRLTAVKTPDALPSGTPARVRRVITSAERLERSAAQLQTLGEEARLLTSVRDAARELGFDLDATLGRLNAATQHAEQLVADSRRDTLTLLKAGLSPDPGAAAMKALEGLARAELKGALAPMIDTLLKGTPIAARPVLRQRLSDALLSGLAA